MSSSTQFRIIIVGGGIGGLAAAISMRAPGRQITILEQSKLHAEIGATISLQPNASRILEKEWKLGEDLKLARGIIDQGFRIFNTEGKVVNTVPLLSKTEYGGDRLIFHRQDLHDSLKSAAISISRSGPPADIRLNSKVVRCDCQNGSVTLEGGEVIEGDLIIGADGIRSVLRTFVVGDTKVTPTGLSAYRLMVPTDVLKTLAPAFCEMIDPTAPFTSMVFAHQCRLIMSPAREGQIYSVVGLVPDEKMNEDPDSKQSWVSRGDLNKMLDTYQDFPDWIKTPWSLAKDIGLWQLRDIDPLSTWVRGRVILIGDAAHAMLPTQGQGASQTVEDAEALGAFFDGISATPSFDQVHQTLQDVFACRYERASLVQKYSRASARPATDKGSNEIKMYGIIIPRLLSIIADTLVRRPDEFMDYNCLYRGARDWQTKHSISAGA